MTRILLFVLLSVLQLTAFAQQRRPIDNEHPMWLVHVDVWNQADPQKIIDLIPADIKPYVVMNLSLSCSYDKDLGIYMRPQNAIRTYKSWASVCQNNGMWFTCQPASGGHTHLQDDDLETFEYFFKRYPNFLGWNYAEQFWGFNEPGDKSSSSDVTRIALFAKLVEMSHKYGGFLTVSFCGNIWSHHLNPVGMMKRNSDLMAACKKYPEAILWLYKYTTSSCFYNNESVTFGPFVAGLANNYGVRYDNCGWNGALDAILGENHGKKYPVAAGIGTVMEQTCQNGGAVWDGPELIWTEDFCNLSRSTDTGGYTQRNWGTFSGFRNAWLDMWHKIIDGTMYIPSRKEVVEKTKFIIQNDVNSGSIEDMYATWGDLYDGLYKQTDPFNRGNGQWMDNFLYLKKTGRYGTIPMTPDLNDDLAKSIPNIIKKSQRTAKLPNSSKAIMFNAAYPLVSTGDLFVSRHKNQLVTYTPYSYMNKYKTASANIPLKYNTCESIDLKYGKLSSGIIREYSDSICVYLNNYRSDTTMNVVDRITINGVKSEPTLIYKKRVEAVGVVTPEWDAEKHTFTVIVSHNGPFDIKVLCSGEQTDRATDAIAITPLSEPKQPEVFVGELIIEAEDMNYKDIQECVDNYYYTSHRSVRGHSGNGFMVIGTKTTGSLKAQFTTHKAGEYNVSVRYSTPSAVSSTLTYQVNNGRATTVKYDATENNKWKKMSFKATLPEGKNRIIFTNKTGKNIYIDQMIVTPADIEAEKFGIVVREAENGSAIADVEECEEGKTVTLSAQPDEGYELVGWTIIHGDITITSDNTFVMPDDNVTVQPIFKDMTAVYALDYTDVLGGTFPPGWRAEFTGWDGKETVQEYPNSYGSGPRMFSGFTGTFGKALYWRGGNANYGKQNNYRLALKPGDYKLTYRMAAWKEAPKYNAQIETASGTVVKTGESYTAAPNANGNTSANLSSAAERVLEFTIEKEGNYVISFVGSGEMLLVESRINKVLAPSAIEDIIASDADASTYEIYDVTGKRLPSLQRGLNIIRQRGMDVKKIYLK